MFEINDFNLDNLIKNALNEDMPYGDITTDSIVEKGSMSKAVIVFKEDGVLAGLDIAAAVFETLDRGVAFEKAEKDGNYLKKGTTAAKIEGNTRVLLKGERTALNILQRLSGIATAVWRMCEQVKGLPVRIVDTRKTTPGLRALEKYAVLMGGGKNHRFSLSDGVLIKDNHIAAAGNITNAVERAREKISHMHKIEVETENLSQVEEALKAGADIILLDNMDTVTMKKAVDIIKGRVLTEASGNITEKTVRSIAITGVDMISTGAVTHSAKALDISMNFI